MTDTNPLKILVIGPQRVGKTVICDFLSDHSETPKENYKPTQGVRWEAAQIDELGIFFLTPLPPTSISESISLREKSLLEGGKDGVPIVHRSMLSCGMFLVMRGMRLMEPSQTDT
mmetsp:Transcript_7356/g.19082  ORF Transcript_7356/g.19082 Transcript_7356/m.19082 type:complete len:115 (-) Transcript_7356:733-1077(-)